MLDIIFALIIGILGFSVGVVFLKNSNRNFITNTPTIKRITIQIGERTQIHGQSIYPSSLNAIKSTVSALVNPILVFSIFKFAKPSRKWEPKPRIDTFCLPFETSMLS